MAGPKSPIVRVEPMIKPPRNSSMDSAISAISSKGHSHKDSQDSQPGAADIGNLIKTAGSPEAVIQYLLKEKQSQAQQNAQLWRLVDKQRAMILGLNKDLERALKDKEKYRKKLKEILASPEIAAKAPRPLSQLVPAALDVPRPALGLSLNLPSGPAGESGRLSGIGGGGGSTRHGEGLSDSPTTGDSDSQKQSPIDIDILPVAPYPITPPADQPAAPVDPVANLLDGPSVMPDPQKYAYRGFDHEAQAKEADKAEKARKEKQQQEELQQLALHLPPPSSPSPPPPSRSPPREPPHIPIPELPLPPTASSLPNLVLHHPSPQVDNDIVHFPTPPRKPPPAPLRLARENKPDNTSNDLDEEESEFEFDDNPPPEVTEILDDDRRGRRRTRQEDDRIRHAIAIREAESRSQSKKSKSSVKSQLRPTTPKISSTETSPKSLSTMTPVGSLAGMLSSTPDGLQAPLRSPGLPSSPRPMNTKQQSGPNALSPRGFAGPPPLSPRPPRQAITIPPSPSAVGPHQPPPTESPPDSVDTATAVTKKPSTDHHQSSQAKTGEWATDESGIYKGFATDEYPGLLLPPNALPSIEVKVASSRMKPSRASLLSLTQLEEDPVFTLAIFSRAEKGELWRVEKDTLSLQKLDQKMKQCASFTAKAPERSLFSGHSPAKLDARRVAMDRYLDELVNTHLDVNAATELCLYLSTNTLAPVTDLQTESPKEKNTWDEAATGGGGGGPVDRPFRSGYLTKRGKNFGGWKARFFVLEGPQLQYYDCPGGTQLGRIKLQNAQIGKQSAPQGGGGDTQSPAPTASAGEDSDNQYRHAFLIMEPKKKDSSSHIKHVLCAESDRERDQWVDALLQWIDHKTSDDEDVSMQPPKSLRERRASTADSDRVKAAAKKKAHTRSMAMPEGVVGVSYDSTRSGDSPSSSAPRESHRRRASVSLAETSSHSGSQLPATEPQPSMVVSAPRDSQVVSDAGTAAATAAAAAASWTTKMMSMGLAPPNSDDKKHKKRSFFGFGTKPRSSTDSQEPLFGSDGGGGGGGGGNAGTQTGTAAAQGGGGMRNSYMTRQSFGASLADAVRYNPPSDFNVPLPAVVYRCIQYLDSRSAIYEEGIFRLSGSNVVIKALRERFNIEGDVNLLTDETYYDIHAVASLLKLYLRELPTTILTRDLHLHFATVSELADPKERVPAYAELVTRLPQANATLLKYLIAFLIKIIKHQDRNKMTVRNVGIVFSPTLNIPAPVFASLLQNYEAIFGIDPEEYELPSPVSDESGAGMNSFTASSARPSFEPGPRPGTSSGSGGTGASPSPSRQRLMETMDRDHGTGGVAGYHSHLVHTAIGASRGSPTPSQRSERQLFEQQGGSVPAGGMAPSQTGGGGGLSVYGYDNSFSSKRRESAIFMNPPSAVGSKSRLREETGGL